MPKYPANDLRKLVRSNLAHTLDLLNIRLIVGVKSTPQLWSHQAALNPGKVKADERPLRFFRPRSVIGRQRTISDCGNQLE